VEREDALDTDAVRDLADGEGGPDAVPATGDADALEGLQTLLLPFLHADVHAERVAGAERGDGLQIILLGLGERVHVGLRAPKQPAEVTVLSLLRYGA